MFSTGCAAGALMIAALPGAAQASPVALDSCDGATLGQPFTQWLDYSSYKLAPGGDFEGTLSGWSLSAGARQVGGSESYGVTGAVGSSSLSLPARGSAVSPSFCVDAAYPDFRFFTRTDTPGVIVTESVIYNTLLGRVTIPVGVATPGTSWQPTLPVITASAIPGLLGGGVVPVSLQFTATGGAAQIDDVYVDPMGRCC